MSRLRSSAALMRATILLVAILALAACAGTPGAQAEAADGTVFVVVRHGEKADAGHDPALSEAGLARADRLAGLLANAPLVAVYSTDLRRTRQTVGPTASAHGLEVRIYAPREPAADLVARLRAAHGTGTVLVAGHSNTVPDIVAALCACEVAAMPETEFDRFSTVRIGADGRPRLEVGRY